MNATATQALIERPSCPNCRAEGKTVVRTTIAEIGRWPKFCGSHYRLEELGLSPETPLSIRWCIACDLGFADPLLDPEHVRRLYNDVIVKPQARATYARSLDYRRRQARLILSLLEANGPQTEPRRLLDFGAGWGLFLHEARDRGWEPHAIELADEERSCLEKDEFKVYPVLDDAPDGFFDAVGSTQVLEHVADFQEITRACAAKLRRGGLLYIDVPNAGHFARRHGSWSANPLEHVNYFTHRFLTRWLSHQPGFELVWPRLLASPRQSWRAVRQALGLSPLTVIFRKRFIK